MASHTSALDLYYAGAWHTAAVRTEAPIVTDSGGDAAAETVTAETLSATLLGSDYDVTDPVAALYGIIGRGTPVRWTLDGVVVFRGEVRSLQPRRPANGPRDTLMQAVGTIDRYQRREALRSAAHRWITTASPAPLVYWPLEDPAGALQADSGLPGGRPMAPSALIGRFGAPPAGIPSFGAGTNVPAGSAPLVSLSDGGQLAATVPEVAGSWETHWTMTLPSGGYLGPDSGGGAAFDDYVIRVSSSPGDWAVSGYYDVQVTFDDGALKLQVSGGGAAFTGVGIFQTTPLRPYDAAPHHYELYAWQYDASNWALNLQQDGTYVDGLFVPGVMTPITQIVVNQDSVSGPQMPTAIGHIAHYSPYLSTPEQEGILTALYGWHAESAGRRIERLMDEEGVPFAAGTHDLDATEPMGPQGVAPLVDHLAECQRTDDGVLYADPAAAVYRYLPRGERYNAPADVTLPRDGAVRDPLWPEVADLVFANDVTAEAPDGRRARATLDAGPLGTAGLEGRRPVQHAANPAGMMADQAAWQLRRRTSPSPRWPDITVILDRVPALAPDLLSLHPGSRVDLTGPLPDVAQLTVTKRTVRLAENGRLAEVVIGAVPSDTLWVPEVGSEAYQLIGAEASTVTSAYTVGASTHMQVSTAGGYGLWSGRDAPYDVMASGARLTVDDVGQALSPGAYPRAPGDAAAWTCAGGVVAYSTAERWHPDWASLAVTPDGTSASGGLIADVASWAAVTAGTSYTLSARVMSPGGWTDIRLAVDWWTASTYVSTSFAVPTTALAAGEWRYLTGPVTAPATATRAALRVRFGGTPPAALLYYATGVSIAATSTVTASPQGLEVCLTPVNGIVKTIPAGAGIDVYPDTWIGM